MKLVSVDNTCNSAKINQRPTHAVACCDAMMEIYNTMREGRLQMRDYEKQLVPYTYLHQ